MIYNNWIDMYIAVIIFIVVFFNRVMYFQYFTDDSFLYLKEAKTMKTCHIHNRERRYERQLVRSHVCNLDSEDISLLVINYRMCCSLRVLIHDTRKIRYRLGFSSKTQCPTDLNWDSVIMLLIDASARIHTHTHIESHTVKFLYWSLTRLLQDRIFSENEEKESFRLVYRILRSIPHNRVSIPALIKDKSF